MSPDESFLEVLGRALAECRLEAIIVGMTAAALQGAPVLTQDVDLLLRDTVANRRKLKALAKAIGAAPQAVTRELSSVVTFLGARAPVDAIFDALPGGLKFESVRARSLRIRVGSAELRVATLADIIRSKRAAGRKKDVAQLPVLEATLATLEKA